MKHHLLKSNISTMTYANVTFYLSHAFHARTCLCRLFRSLLRPRWWMKTHPRASLSDQIRAPVITRAFAVNHLHTVVFIEVIAALRRVIISQDNKSSSPLTSFQTGFSSLSTALVFFFSPVSIIKLNQVCLQNFSKKLNWQEQPTKNKWLIQ